MLSIIAGPCSIDLNNFKEIEQILSIEVKGKRAIVGTRVVGLKSRTAFDKTGKGMGMDFENFLYNSDVLISGGNANDFKDLPSILLARELQEKFNCIIASEIMDSAIQMPLFDKYIKGVMMPWNPAVNSLGWNIFSISKYCEKNNWLLGIKNPKNLGINPKDSEENNISAPMEKVWSELAGYSNLTNERKILIHRGVDCEIKGDFRAVPVHKSAMRTKALCPGVKLFFDPSHSFGAKLRDKIYEETIEAMKLKDLKGNYLYDGILIEVGTSETDIGQHITIMELENMVKELVKFREI